jgi:hypothetical protein
MIAVETKPSVLVSFAYARAWSKVCDRDLWREVVLDSGAFTAHRTGETIDVDAFGDWVISERARDPRVTEAFTLDVIGDWRASLKNTERLWSRGVEVIPVYHVGEPHDLLVKLARDYPKVSLGGAVGYRRKMEWAALCFRAVWPKKIHGLGFGESAVRRLPFHTVDASNWDSGPGAFGNFSSFGAKLPTRSTNALRSSLRCEVDFYLDEEARARRFYDGRLPSDFGVAPSIRLALYPSDLRQLKSLAPTEA